MLDHCGRTIDYLRISLTPNCDLNCFYCQPEKQETPISHLLTPEEIERFVLAAATLGVSHVRLTGGEPLLRPDLEDIIRRIAAVQGISDVSLTTNAQSLALRAASLKAAGLNRVNISLDTLSPERYRRFTDGGQLERVFAGINAAEAIGLLPIHLNVVVIKGVNDDEINDLARLTLLHSWDVRFIELMSIGVTRSLDQRQLLSANDIWRQLGEPEKEPSGIGAGPAKYFRLPGALGRVGLISAVSDHFCALCNRIRLTSLGRLRLCLLSEQELDFRALLREGVPIRKLASRLREAISDKPVSQPSLPSATRRMSEIGG